MELLYNFAINVVLIGHWLDCKMLRECCSLICQNSQFSVWPLLFLANSFHLWAYAMFFIQVHEAFDSFQ